jgi:hypothetical protein
MNKLNISVFTVKDYYNKVKLINKIWHFDIHDVPEEDLDKWSIEEGRTLHNKFYSRIINSGIYGISIGFTAKNDE